MPVGHLASACPRGIGAIPDRSRRSRRLQQRPRSFPRRRDDLRQQRRWPHLQPSRQGRLPKRISNDHDHPHHRYLHGISPDGETLAYVAVEQRFGQRRINIFTVPARGGPDQRITDLDLPHDGPEYSFDGQWIFFNSERSSPGQSQCFRMRADGSGLEQLTHDDRVNWFPHPSPDGRHVVYLSYPEGTQGHPPDRHVLLRLMRPDGSARRDLVALHGGQGTINVNPGLLTATASRSWPIRRVREKAPLDQAERRRFAIR